MKLRHAVILVLLVYIVTLTQVGWIIASDMTGYQQWSTLAWLIAGMGAILVLVLRWDRFR